jgi:hypothetical protein
MRHRDTANARPVDRRDSRVVLQCWGRSGFMHTSLRDGAMENIKANAGRGRCRRATELRRELDPGWRSSRPQQVSSGGSAIRYTADLLIRRVGGRPHAGRSASGSRGLQRFTSTASLRRWFGWHPAIPADRQTLQRVSLVAICRALPPGVAELSQVWFVDAGTPQCFGQMGFRQPNLGIAV